jgi:hypothetical protein
MDEAALAVPAAVRAAARDRRGGATEVARQALDGLLEVAGDPARLAAAVAVLLDGQPAMAPVWHLARAAGGPAPGPALAALRDRLDGDGAAAAAAAAAWLRRWGGPVGTVSHSSLVDQVLARLGVDPDRARAAGRDPDRARVAVVGADAVGPDAVLNAAGTGALAARLPTLVVATPLKLVPAGVFGRLAAPGFEAVPLAALAAVALPGEVVAPAVAGRRAAALA